MTTEVHLHFHGPITVHTAPDPRVLSAIHDLKEIIMSTAQETVDALKGATEQLDAATTQLAKVGTETAGLQQTVADLQTIIQSQGSNVPAEVSDQVALVVAAAGRVKAATQAVDDKVVDQSV